MLARANSQIKLVDSYQRKMRKLRVSLLDVCNFRCFYCMPEDAKFMQASKWLKASEIIGICSELVQLGIEELRITGGEPTLRPEFREILTGLAQLELKKFGITTNGLKLAQELPFLQSIGCRNLNVSLDSLEPNTFFKITRNDSFDKVFRAILKAKEMGLHVKINTVIMRGINNHELSDFLNFSKKYDIEVRFLELMKIGQACGVQEDLYVSADEMLLELKKQDIFDSVPVEQDSTSFNYTSFSGANIGFIASESKPFCGDCSRWRLSADGFLRACLMSEKGVKIKDVPIVEYPNLLAQLLPMKPIQRLPKVAKDMNRIGG